MKKNNILVLDIGTTGIKGLVFGKDLELISRSYFPLKKVSRRGFVEQNPQELVQVSERALRGAIKKSGVPPTSFRGMGITNQRETTILWDKKTGKPVYPAIVWEDTRTAEECKKMSKQHRIFVRNTTGLALDPYFSASKVKWILENVPQAKKISAQKNLLFGTVDTWILWNLLEKHPHVTDYTNASRTLLFNIRNLKWDKKLLSIFGVPQDIVPRAQPSVSNFGKLDKKIIGVSLPVVAVCGDQQASLFAAGLSPGTTKVTYGTGGFVSQILGRKFALHDGFFTTLAPYLKSPIYALEAKVNDCGARVTAVLKNPLALKKAIETIIKEISRYLKKLPRKPKAIIIDGGVTKYEDMITMHEQLTGIPSKKQKIYDGTALGTAMLVKTFFRT